MLVTIAIVEHRLNSLLSEILDKKDGADVIVV